MSDGFFGWLASEKNVREFETKVFRFPLESCVEIAIYTTIAMQVSQLLRL